jgi:prephenate dehydrogenase
MIAPDLQPNALIIDTSPIKVSITEWAKELLPPDRHFVTFTPSLNPAYLHETASGIDAAHADLFHKSLTLITSLSGANPDAVKFAADLATLVGSKPLFADAYESDGLVAATRLLPQILAAAMVNATIDQPGWTEARKFAGQAYVQATEPAAHLTDTNRLGETFLLNRENVLRVMDNLTGAMNQIREALAEEDEATLHALLHNAREDRRIWFVQRETANWEPNIKSEMPRAGDVVGRLFGLGRRRTEK